MMKLLSPAIVLAGAACGSDADVSLLGPASGLDARPIGICDGGKALLLNDMKLTCDAFPASPVASPLPFWPGKKPCKKDVTGEMGELLNTIRYDYAKAPKEVLPVYGEATYTGSGNLLTWKPTEFFGDEARTPTVFYEYDGDRLSGARVEFPDGTKNTYAYGYDGDRRVTESRVTDRGSEVLYHYVYDDEDRLEREGCPGRAGAPPPPPADEVLAACLQESNCGADCPAAFRCADGPNGPYVVPMLEVQSDGFACSVAQVTHRYDDTGRLHTTILGSTPGLLFGRLRYGYEDGNLKTVTGGRPDSSDPSQGLQRWTYHFECAE